MEQELELVVKFIEENKSFIEENPADKIPGIFKDKYRKYVEILCDNNIELGLLEKAYGSYSGNAVFPQDWKVSEEYLLKLVSHCQNPWAANSLGYIYYYGRTTNGVPDYDKALKYFTIAMMADITEAKYKLCDMLVSGNGFPAKMPDVAYNRLIDLYDDLRPEFERGCYSCEFADVAIRLGNMDMKTAMEHDGAIHYAYRYYMIGKYALELRMKHEDHYGDNSVMARLMPNYEKAKAGFSKWMRKNSEGKNRILDIPSDFASEVSPRVKVKKLGNGSFFISMTMDENGDEDDAIRVRQLVAIPELDFCRLIGRIELNSKLVPVFNSPDAAEFFVDYLEIENGSIRFIEAVESTEYEGMDEMCHMVLPIEGLEITRLL